MFFDVGVWCFIYMGESMLLLCFLMLCGGFGVWRLGKSCCVKRVTLRRCTTSRFILMVCLLCLWV